MKSDVEIRQDVYTIVKASAINDAISGSVRYIPRSTGSSLEDCVISVVDGDCGQIQDAVVNVNVYVPNMTSGGESVENIPRTAVLAKLCETALESCVGDGFRIYLEKQHLLAVNGKDEYVINNRVRYKFNNE